MEADVFTLPGLREEAALRTRLPHHWPTSCRDARIVVSSSNDAPAGQLRLLRIAQRCAEPDNASNDFRREQADAGVLRFSRGPYNGLFEPITDHHELKDGLYSETRKPVGNLPNSPENVFQRFRRGYRPPRLRRHTD